MDNLSDIFVFVQVVDSGSFTATAERLKLSKSVISKYVTRLEGQLGARLLNRTTRRLSLTEAGRILYQRSQKGLRLIEDVQSEISQLQQAPRGELRLNTPMSFGIKHIAPSLGEFIARYPEMTVDMSLDDRQLDLVEEGFDLAIRIDELPDSSLVARRLSSCRHVVCASQEYLDRYGEPATLEDLSKHQILAYRYQDSPNEWRFMTPDKRYVSTVVKGAIQMNNSLALREAVLQGAGIMLTPTFVVGDDIKAGRLKQLLVGYKPPEISIYAVYPERRFLSPKIRAFIDFFKQRLSDPPYWD